jgi:amidase
MTHRRRHDDVLFADDIPTGYTAATTATADVAPAYVSHLISTSEWTSITVHQLQRALQTKKISALELVDRTIAHIEAADVRINAVVIRDFEQARAAARSADAALARGDRRPLLGIPVTIKEAFNVAGLPTTWGLPQFKDFVPDEDALIVSRLKSAGAVLLGKTNVPMGLADFQSYNAIYGTTNNPWDTKRSPGGSSGGSAAALAAGFGQLSFGSDIGGSLRVPAHFCGVYAHKPSLGLVPLRGYNPPPFPPQPGHGDLAVAGPMARTAADLSVALEVVAGPDAYDCGVGYRLALPDARHDNIKSFRVLVIDNHPLMPIDSAVRQAISSLSTRLAKAGVRVAHTSALLPDFTESAKLYMRLLASAKSDSITPDIYQQSERAESALGSDDSLGAERTRGTVLSHRNWLETDEMRKRLQEQWRMFFREWDVVVYPAAPVPAVPHDQSMPIEARAIEVDGKQVPYYDAFYLWADPASTYGLPATAAPIDRSPTGLPIGIQIIGSYLEDRTTISFAALLEREFGGFVPPPGL